MLAIYSREERYTHKLQRSAPGDWDQRTVSDWSEWEWLATDGATCSVLCIPWLTRDPDANRLAAFKSRFPMHPVVLVTSGDISNARALGSIFVEDVVWLQDVERDLRPAVGRACILSQTRDLAEMLRTTEHLPRKLRVALALACSAEKPFHTVSTLASSVGCDRRTLWNQWKGCSVCESMRLQDFLHWLLLLRAAGAKTPDRSWAEVAEDLGVHPQTLSRLSRQLAGAPLSEVAAGGQAAVAERFKATVLDPLLAEEG